MEIDKIIIDGQDIEHLNSGIEGEFLVKILDKLNEIINKVNKHNL